MKTQITNDMIDDCKQSLPPVRISVAGVVHWGRLSGRLNQFAGVTITCDAPRHAKPHIFKDWYFSWYDVCYAVVSGVPLKTAEKKAWLKSTLPVG